MIVVFDLGGPLLAYGLLRSAGMSAVATLVISGVLPALGCLLSLRLRQPGRLAVSGIPDDHRGVGAGYLAEAAIRVAIVVTTSTGSPWSAPS